MFQSTLDTHTSKANSFQQSKQWYYEYPTLHHDYIDLEAGTSITFSLENIC